MFFAKSKVFQFLSTLLLGLMLSLSLSAQKPLAIIEELEKFHPEMGNISISQDGEIGELLNAYYVQNASRPGMQGFRIRIYFDLGQHSRASSLEVMNEFMEEFPGLSVYRTFQSPYYKVSVGDFRSRDEALKQLKRLSHKYPKAFIISEWINFPRLD
jgi:hypothetical protein